MPNSNFDLTEKEERVLSVLKNEYRANPYLIREETGLGKGEVNTALIRLATHGWIRKVTRGLYEYEADPRETEE